MSVHLNDFSGKQIGHRSAEFSVLGGVRCIGSVDCNQHAFGIRFAFKYKLVVGEHNIAIGSVAKCIASCTFMNQFLDKRSKLIRSKACLPY